MSELWFTLFGWQAERLQIRQRFNISKKINDMKFVDLKGQQREWIVASPGLSAFPIRRLNAFYYPHTNPFGRCWGLIKTNLFSTPISEMWIFSSFPLAFRKIFAFSLCFVKLTNNHRSPFLSLFFLLDVCSVAIKSFNTCADVADIVYNVLIYPLFIISHIFFILFVYLALHIPLISPPYKPTMICRNPSINKFSVVGFRVQRKK